MAKNALISVYNKEGVIDFARELFNLGYRILSTGGTADLLRKNGINAIDVSDYTGQKEILNGRVKTLHPKIFGGILAAKKEKKHLQEIKNFGIEKIELVAVNLYPFQDVIEKKAKLNEIIENIDIGGHSLIRASAKNYKEVAIIVEPSDYNFVVEKIKNRKLDEKTKSELAAKAFLHAAKYDTIISRYFADNFLDVKFPEILNFTFRKIQDLRYGENPHQEAAFYRTFFVNETCISTAKQLHGKQLSYNNILDANDAFELIKEFNEPTAAVIKHTNPSGVASAAKISEAYKRAYETDTVSAFGSIVALNMPCDLETAKLMGPLFVEVVICPKFDKDAVEVLAKKKNLRLLEAGPIIKRKEGYDIRSVTGGLLVQKLEGLTISKKDLKIVTKRKPDEKEIEDMLFAWKVNKHTKSNSVVFAKDKVTVGIGAGQMSRVDAVKLAVMKSGGKCRNSVMSSDAYFPFRDGVDEAAKAGATAIIQPGGSIRDKEAIKAADEYNIAMVFTGYRLFRH